ncbi:hypothetical protein [Actinoallomurus iriomotensis]|uniref:hypothetical protein n=1 Tax=Actinoallomurus iriomotensis TaxID=478107 RepID=UPI0025527764|nr:hypothetical protein [Actinoallomurus iriomotensis]
MSRLVSFEHLRPPQVADDPGAFGGVVDDGAGTPVTRRIAVEPMNLLDETEFSEHGPQW